MHHEGEQNGRSSAELARYFCDRVLPALEVVRKHADHLETLIDDDLWPLPRYEELLFVR